MHNDVHKVTARNKWRVEKLKLFVCMRYASALSAVHNMAGQSNNTILETLKLKAEMVHA
jgi:hypothetical protein